MGQPLGVAIIGGGTSDLVRKARGLGRQVWPSLKSFSTQLSRPPPPATPPQPFSPPWPRIGGRYPGDIAHGPCRHTGRGRGGRRRRGGGRREAQGGPQGRDDGGDGLSDGHIGDLHEAADDGRPAKPIAGHLHMVSNGVGVRLWGSRRPLSLLSMPSMVHALTVGLTFAINLWSSRRLTGFYPFLRSPSRPMSTMGMLAIRRAPVCRHRRPTRSVGRRRRPPWLRSTAFVFCCCGTYVNWHECLRRNSTCRRT